jgi:hypothetical protein
LSSSNPETPTSENNPEMPTMARPMGRKAAKKNGKCKEGENWLDYNKAEEDYNEKILSVLPYIFLHQRIVSMSTSASVKSLQLNV